jgi:hypothetical protein
LGTHQERSHIIDTTQKRKPVIKEYICPCASYAGIWGEWGYFPLILKVFNTWRRVVSIMTRPRWPKEIFLCAHRGRGSIRPTAGRDFWRQEQFYTPAGSRALQLVAFSVHLSRYPGFTPSREGEIYLHIYMY